MRTGRIVGGGVLAGVISAVAVALIGGRLGFRVSPWDWSSPAGGSLGRWLELSWVAIALVPVMVVAGVITAAVCAAVFECVTGRGGWGLGGVVGLFTGTIAFSVVGLLPWAASWYGYAYFPIVAPFGRSDPVWPFVLIIAVGVAMGSITGAMYGAPVHAGHSPPRLRWRQIYPP
ncbi:MAG TPA: hypothetical protein VL173_12520 [Vicinamibacterales bacterium]|nr:hypothetical protein [Vicinamibacterales bacterium]